MTKQHKIEDGGLKGLLWLMGAEVLHSGGDCNYEWAVVTHSSGERIAILTGYEYAPSIIRNVTDFDIEALEVYLHAVLRGPRARRLWGDLDG